MEMDKLQKLMLANQGRLMCDNQKVLDSSNQRSERFQQWEAGDVLKLKGIATQADRASGIGSDDMQISIDSPVTTTNHYVTPPTPSRGPGFGTLAKLAIGAGLLGTGVGAGVGIPLLLDALKPKPPVVIREPGETKTITKQGRANVIGRPAVIVDDE